MQLGRVGLGRMRGSVARRLIRESPTRADECLSAMRHRFAGYVEEKG